MSENLTILRGCRSDRKYQVKRPGMKTLLIEGFEAGVIDTIREDLTTEQKIRLVDISQLELEKYFVERTKSLTNFCLQALSVKWYCRETDTKLVSTKFELPELNYRTFSKLKQELKKGKLSITEMELIIDHFYGDQSDWYNKNYGTTII